MDYNGMIDAKHTSKQECDRRWEDTGHKQPGELRGGFWKMKP
jgi:hypothetical protein